MLLRIATGKTLIRLLLRKQSDLDLLCLSLPLQQATSILNFITCIVTKSHEVAPLDLISGEKPFVCDSPDCGKRFAELSSLKKHIVTHTGKQYNV